MRTSAKRLLGAGVLTLLVGTAAYFATTPERLGPPGQVKSLEYLTPSVTVDGIYPSMLGPSNTDLNVKLTQGADVPELLWVTGYTADMVGPQDEEPRSAEFMCHNTLSIHDTVNTHNQVMGSGSFRNRRLFTLSQGQDTLDFPEGFGIPVSSAERFMLQSQVLNLRHDRIGTQVRHKVRTKFISDREAGRDMQPLVLISSGIALEVLDEKAGKTPLDPLSCAVDAGGNRTTQKGDQEFTAHWIVSPGPEKRVNKLGRHFPFDTTIHYVAIHMHAYGQSLELRDMTTGQTVYKAICKPTREGDGLAEVGYYSSAEGLPVYADHEYELISHYNNTSKENKTAMAFFLAYVKDPNFRKPDPDQLALRSEEFCTKAPENYAAQARPGKR